MALLPILSFNDPLFRSVATKVSDSELKSPEFQQFLDDFAQTCVENNGAGLGAPQVGKRKRVIVLNIDPTNPRYPDKAPLPLTLVINPRIVKRSREMDLDWEGSLSCDVQAIVPRHAWVHVKGLDRNGEEVRFEVDDPFQARVFQHEIGYLDGEVFLDLVENKSSIRPVGD